MEAAMGEFSRRDAMLCILVGGVLGFVIGVNVRGSFETDTALGPMASAMHWGFGGLMGMGVGLFWLFFWLLLIRGLFWRSPSGWRGRGRRGRYYAGRLEDLPADFDDWHRRAHERMKEATPADDPGGRG
jgi:hypothetical protein